MKNVQDCIEFANATPVCYLATADEDRPRVRALGFWFADATGFYFQTASMKEIPRQLEKNPRAEVCFYKQEGATGIMLRIGGETEFVYDRALKEKAIAERPFLKTFGLSADSPQLVLFRIAHGEAHFWTMENNLKPKEIIIF